MFDSILIANRGEIACRIIRTAQRLGIRTLAVYSDADSEALHVRRADAAIRIGPAAARESYLNIDAIIEAALKMNARAIHPGYGFLSENASFAAACQVAGIVFIGPPESAIRAMGSKIEAKRLMARSGVPIVPGYQEDEQDLEHLEAAAAKLGFPILIKASAGGGGKGMRVVESKDALAPALEGARREAKAAFGDDRVLLEKYLSRPRHIEIQVFADAHGNCIHLHERDCSIQRRHQKVIEEAPAPGMSAARRRMMGAAAVRAAKAVGYQGAGTVEFIVVDGAFYFMEMNTRLQVEHPVTEMITGLDLVEWQIRVAAGEKLPLEQAQVPLKGHAIEARLYAEDPEREFLPSTGRLIRLRWPPTGDAVRVDTGVQEGDAVGVYYDPMLAKIIAWGEERIDAIRRLSHALSECQIAGVTTNAALLRAVLSQSHFVAGEVHTGFVGEHATDLFKATDADGAARLRALGAVGWLLGAASATRGPWDLGDGWQLNLAPRATLQFEGEDAPVVAELERVATTWQVTIGLRRFVVEAHIDADGTARGQVDGVPLSAQLVVDGRRIYVISGGRVLHLVLHDPAEAGERERHDGGLIAPMPGQVLQVMVTVGAVVRRGQPLVIVEAMKMEHTILAPMDGVVEQICFGAGERVSEGVQLLKLKASSGS
jgi:3-methylcrotonyl-CoA carboxylase alpha subunit